MSRRKRERHAQTELDALHNDDWLQRTHSLPRTLWAGKGYRRAFGRLTLIYYGLLLAIPLAILIINLLTKLLSR